MRLLIRAIGFWIAGVASATAQSSWRPFASAGPAVAGAEAHREAPDLTYRVTGLGSAAPRTVTDSYLFNGMVFEGGAERRLSAQRSLRLTGTVFAGGDLAGGCIEQRCSYQSQAYAVSSLLTLHRSSVHRWGPSLALGAMGMQARRKGGYGSGDILGTAFGGVAQFAFSFGAIHHVAPVLELKQSVLRRTDGFAMLAGSFGIFLQSR